MGHEHHGSVTNLQRPGKKRYEILLEREDILNAILDFIASQIGSLTNPTNIANALTSMRHEPVSNNLVSSYLTHTMDAFLIERARRYDVKGKTYFNYPNLIGSYGLSS